MTAQSTPPLERDLALVLPALRWLEDANVTAMVRGDKAGTDDAIAEAAKLLASASAPAITGLGWLTIEAVREAVALIETLRGRIIAEADPVAARIAVTQTATLGHLYACDLIVWVGQNARSGAIADAITSRVPHSINIEASVEQVLSWRNAIRSGELPFNARRVGVVSAAKADPRVVAQWHKLAADVQKRIRVAVVTLPDAGTPPNARGAHEVVCWQTGLSLHNAGVSFADGSPRPCSSSGNIDVLIDATGNPSVAGQGIHLGRTHDPRAAVSFATPGLALGLAAQVARFDGVILWLCEDPVTAPPDPTVQLLTRLHEEVRRLL